MTYFLLDTLCNAFTTHAEAPQQNQPTEALKVDRAHAGPSAAPAAATPWPAQRGDSADASPETRLQELLNDGKDCQLRACSTTKDLFVAFGAHMKQQQQQQAGSYTSSDRGSSSGGSSNGGSSSADNSQQKRGPSSDMGEASEKPTFWFYEEEMPEPPDVVDIGRATWTLLHTMAAYYPDKPSPQQQDSMRAFIGALGDHYPCHECRSHLRKDLQQHPPDVAGAEALSMWACGLHNRVNAYLGKPGFDCSLAFQRWRDGPPQHKASEGEAKPLYGLSAHNREVDEVEAGGAAAAAMAPAVTGTAAVAAAAAAAAGAGSRGSSSNGAASAGEATSQPKQE